MDKSEALRKLQEVCTPNTVVYTVLRHTSQSGMTRAITAFVVHNGEPFDLDFLIARADIGYKYDQKHSGLKVQGVGMDMGFALVYSLGQSLFPNNEGGDSGYMLKHRWF